MRRTCRALGLAMSGLLLATTVACGDDESGGDDGSGGSGASTLDELDVVPATATNIEISHRADAAERLGVAVETGATGDELGEYAETMSTKAPWAGTQLDMYLHAMNEEAAFSAFDVDWQAVFSVEGGALTYVWKLDDDVDLDAVGDDLAASGYEEQEIDGLRTFTADFGSADTSGLADGKYPVAAMREVTLVPDEGMILAGPAEEALEVIAGDAESMADAGSAAEVTTGLDDAEYVALQSGSGVLCVSARTTPEESGLSSLEHPTAVAFAVLPGDGDDATPRNVFAFEDDDTAEADATARKDYLASGTSSVTQEPIADLLDNVDVSTDGSVETVDYTFADGPGRAFQMVRLFDVVSSCNPE